MPETRFEAIGAQWAIATPEPAPVEVLDAVRERVADFDAVWSRFRGDSFVARLAREGGAHTVDADGASMLDVYARLAEATGGAVSPLVARSLERLGYDPSYSLRPAGTALAAPVLSEVLSWDGTVLDLAEPSLLDVGAIGKGRLVDVVSQLLADYGVGEHLVDAGGDLRRRGVGAERIGLEDPRDASRAIAVVDLGESALCASAVNRRAWGPGLHHMLDARTGEPVTEVVATWAGAPSAMEADAAASALFFLTPREARGLGATWTMRMSGQGGLEWSGFPGEVLR